MRRLIGTVVCFGLGMVAMWVAMHFHFVKTDSEWFLVRKHEVRFADCYVDVAKWDTAEWGEHTELQESLVVIDRVCFCFCFAPELKINKEMQCYVP